MSYDNDDDLLAALGRAVGPDLEVTPSTAERDALRSVVLRAGAGPAEGASDAAPIADVVPITSARRLRTRLLVGSAAVVVALSGATAVAAAVNDGALPTPVRAVVHAVGIPVDSVELAQAKEALKRLRTATDAELADALARAERELADLTPSERSSLGGDVDRTLADARERLGRVEAAAQAATSTTTPSTAPATVGTTRPSAPTQPSTGTSTATSIDDRGGRGSDDSTPGTTTGDDKGGGGHGADDSTGSGGTTATSDASGKGGSGGGGSDDSSATSAPGGTTATSDGSGKNRGGDTTPATTSTATTDPSGKGSGSGDGGSGGGGSGGGGGGGG